jgi:hypothetical protein
MEGFRIPEVLCDVLCGTPHRWILRDRGEAITFSPDLAIKSLRHMCVLTVVERVSTRIFAIPIPIGFLGHRSARKSEFSCHRNSTYTSHI